MTKEQLQNGKELAEKIEKLEAQLLGWKTANRLYFETIDLYSNDGKRYDKIDRKYIDFEVLKILTIARIEKELNELKTEFEKL